MSSKESEAGAIILAYAVAHATVAAILANTIVGDAPVLFTLTSLMIYQLASLCGKRLDMAAITATAANLVGVVAGTYFAAKLVTWVPGWGNAINATVTFGMTQVIGWAAFAMFSQGVSQEDAIKYGERRKISKEEMDRILNSMSYDDKSRYESLKNRLKDFNLSDTERQNIVSEMAETINRYR
jgi:uncharacterized protein (DUF697 family)